MMTDMVAVTSTSQVLNARFVDRKDMAPMLKRAAILCDRVFVDTTDTGAFDGDFERAFINAAFGGLADGMDLFEDRRFRTLLLRVEDLSETPAEVVEATRTIGADDRLAEIATEYALTLPDADIAPFTRHRPDHKARGTIRLELLDDLRRPLALRRWLPDPVGILGPMHRDVLSTALREVDSPVDALLELAPATMLDFGALHWNEILRLRSSTHIHDFRRMIREMEHASPSGLRERWQQDLEEIAAFTRPSAIRTLIGGFLGNLPFGNLNPLGASQSIMDYFRADEMSRRFGWVYFVMDARERSQASTPGAP